MSQSPVILAAFANKAGEHLPFLDKEQTELQRIFRENPFFEFVTIFNASIDKVWQSVIDYKDRLVAFHYAGHANSDEIILQKTTGESAQTDAKALSVLLGSCPHLQLVFLNGCLTYKQVDALLQEDINHVIATKSPIDDELAGEFSSLFYLQISKGKQNSIEQAFTVAKVGLEQKGKQRDHAFRTEQISQKRIFEREEDPNKKSNTFSWVFESKEGLSEDNYLITHSMLEFQLRQGSEAFFKKLTEEGIFRDLIISELLLAEASSYKEKLMDLDVRLNEKKLGKKEAIEALWKENVPNAIVYGKGGMGKTVSLLQIWESFLEGRGPIPIFVVLNEYNQADESEREDWIIRYVFRNYLNKALPANKADVNVAIEDFEKWLASDYHSDSPKILLLLDGYNEITVDDKPLRKELLDRWQIHTKGEQILLTSRYGIDTYWMKEFKKIELIELNSDQIQTYLAEIKHPYPDDAALLSVLGNPMMLTIYAATSQIIKEHKAKGKENLSLLKLKSNVNSAGAILWNFLECQLAKTAEEFNYDKEEFQLFRWFLDHFIPALGYKMETDGVFDISRTNFEAFFEDFKEKIKSYRPSKPLEFLFPLCADIWNNLSKIEALSAELIRNLLIKKLRILILDVKQIRRDESEESDLEEEKIETIQFRHQNFRDYFSSIQILNDIRLNHGKVEKVSSIKERFLPVILVDYMADLNDAKEQKLLVSAITSLKEKGVKDVEHNRNLWNLLNIALHANQDLSSFDFSNLRLKKQFNFNQKILASKIKGKFVNSGFQNTEIAYEAFFTNQHTDVIRFLRFHPSKSIFATVSSKKINLWSSLNGVQMGSLTWGRKIHGAHIGKTYIYALNNSGYVGSWKIDSDFEFKESYHPDLMVNLPGISYSFTSDAFGNLKEEKLNIWKINSGGKVYKARTYHFSFKSLIFKDLKFNERREKRRIKKSILEEERNTKRFFQEQEELIESLSPTPVPPPKKKKIFSKGIGNYFLDLIHRIEKEVALQRQVRSSLWAKKQAIFQNINPINKLVDVSFFLSNQTNKVLIFLPYYFRGILSLKRKKLHKNRSIRVDWEGDIQDFLFTDTSLKLSFGEKVNEYAIKDRPKKKELEADIKCFSYDSAGVKLSRFSLCGKKLAQLNTKHSILIWDIEKIQLLHVFPVESPEITDLGFDQKAQSLIVLDSKGELFLYNLKEKSLLSKISTQKGMQSFDEHLKSLNPFEGSLDGKDLFYTSGRDILNVLEAKSGKILYNIICDAPICASVYLAKYKLFICATLNRKINIWDDSATLLKEIAAESAMLDLKFNPQKNIIWGLGEDGNFFFWKFDLKTKEVFSKKKAVKIEGKIECFTLSPDGKIFAYATDRAIKSMDLETGKLTVLRDRSQKSVRERIYIHDLYFSSNSKKLYLLYNNNRYDFDNSFPSYEQLFRRKVFDLENNRQFEYNINLSLPNDEAKAMNFFVQNLPKGSASFLVKDNRQNNYVLVFLRLGASIGWYVYSLTEHKLKAPLFPKFRRAHGSPLDLESGDKINFAFLNFEQNLLMLLINNTIIQAVDMETGKILWVNEITPGLWVHGADFSEVKWNPKLTEMEKKRLIMHGAKL